VGVRRFVGFETDGDHRFLLGDFTVTHNSAVYQIPAMLHEGCCIVFSPLIALMQDQVAECQRRGIAASYINSRLEPDVVEERVMDFVAGAYKLFYVAPERLSVETFRQALAKAQVSFIAVDECHCVSRMGHSFRPDYMKLRQAADIVERATDRRPPLVMLTATCTKGIEDDIAVSLGATDYQVIIGDPIRGNLIYETITPPYSSWAEVRRLAEQHFHDPGRHLVYCGTRSASENAQGS
jgi:ATP-dependent DNA helicase RecQ